MLTAAAVVLAAGPSSAWAASLRVVDLTTGIPVPVFTYLVNIDNSADPFDPDPMNHPSRHPMASYTPIVAAGDQATAGSVPLADGRYLVSVRAPGYKMWGRHVRVAGGVVTDADGAVLPAGVVGIELRPLPLPLSQIRVLAFPDYAPADAAPALPEIDIGPAPFDMSGFLVVIHDNVGEVVVDWFGNPICTAYDSGGSSTPLGDPVPGTGGGCYTNAAGEVTIPNLPYGRYEVFVIPPEPNNGPDGKLWVQTSTFEGGLAVDAWLEEGSSGHGAPGEFLVEPGTRTAYWFGFAPPATFAAPGSATITGTLRNWVPFPPFEQLTLGEPVARPWILVNDLATDRLVYRGRGDEHGGFAIPNVPPGTYQLAFFDDYLSYIIRFVTVEVRPSDTVVDMNLPDAHGQRGVGIFRWFGWISGYVFADEGKAHDGMSMPQWAGNAIRDCMNPSDAMTCEPGIMGAEVVLRERDGSARQATVTDHQGHYELPTARSRLGRADVLEVGAGRFAWTGHSVHGEHYSNIGRFGAPFGDSVQVVPGDLGGDLLVTQLTVEGRRSIVDWGKRPWLPGETGGIAGAVVYATMRNEYDARLQAAEDYEPGIPDVTVNLYEAIPALGYSVCEPSLPETCTAGTLLNSLQSDHYSHPRLGNPENPAACDVLDQFGNSLAADASFPGRAAAALVADNCIEVPMLGNETKDGAWDGGWAFADMCPNGYPCTDQELVPIPKGDYVVEVVPPRFYQVVKEEDNNTAEGDELYPQFPPPPCIGALHTVPDITGDHPYFPYAGEQRPLCDRKLVTVQDQHNAAAEFHLFTTDAPYDPSVTGLGTSSWASAEAVPVPARMFGLVEDDLHMNLDPTSLTYGEPRGVAHIPIGVYESGFGTAAVGRRLLTIYTDELGFYEAVLPSSYTSNCPTPAGLCPAMYVLVINDPGDEAHPNPGFSKAHLTEPAAFEFLPGKYRHTDTPIDPVNALACGLPPDAPQIFRVSSPVFSGGGSLTITGMRFGSDPADPPIVTLGGTVLAVTSFVPAQPFGATPVFEDVVTVTIPAGFAPGAHQLALRGGHLNPRPPTFPGGGGQDARNGITIHVLGGSYDPPVVNVSPPTTLGAAPIQAAIDAAADGSLIVIAPGAYHENVIVHKRVKLQGFGPGGKVGVGILEGADLPCPETPTCPPPTNPGEEPFAHILGTMIDGRFFTFDAARRAAFAATLASISFDGPTPVPVGAAITFLVQDGELGADGVRLPVEQAAQVDGLAIQTARGEAGGGVYVHAYGRNVVISNNIMEANQSTHGGAISIGRPVVMGGRADPARGGNANNENDNVVIHHNRLLENGGISFAGGVGVFGGADGYVFADNDVCGNFSAEYGGGMSHFGFSPGAAIRDNRFYFNDAFDEGAGLVVAGELDVTQGGIGSGDVVIERNLIQANLANDDGGGLRLLRPLGDDPATPGVVENRITILNNVIVNNISADQGGGIALDDASEVVLVNNTVAGNVSTSSAPDSVLGTAHAAGIVSECHSGGFRPANGSTFSDPVMFNNIVFDNLAYRYDSATGTLVADRYIDLEVFGVSCQTAGTALFDPHFSFLSVDYLGGGDNLVGQPLGGPDAGWVQTPSFINAAPAAALAVSVGRNRLNLNELMLTFARPEGTFIGYTNYHLLPVTEASPAIDAGSMRFASVDAPFDDVDGEGRPGGLTWDVGADETLAPPGGVLVLLETAVNVTEADTTVMLTVRRAGASTGTVTLDFATLASAAGPEHATSGVDFVETHGTLTFAPGVVSQTIPIRIIDDSTAEGGAAGVERFYVVLDNPTGGAVLWAGSAQVVGTVTIVDNEANECATGAARCSPCATCIDLPVGYECRCNPGFEGDGTTCADVNECQRGTHDCDPDATCANTQGGFTCTCNPGFIGDGRSCAAACGDGVIAGDEACDDGNQDAGDGCSASCRIEPDDDGDPDDGGDDDGGCPEDAYYDHADTEGDGRGTKCSHLNDRGTGNGNGRPRAGGCSASGSGSMWLVSTILLLLVPAWRRRRARAALAAVTLGALGVLPAAAALADPPPAVCPGAGVDCHRRFIVTDGHANVPGRERPVYIFGFVETDPSLLNAPVTSLDGYKGHVQTSAPFIAVDQGASLYLTLTNLGLVARPDLDDAHTIHWHGFRNTTPIFDGVPDMAVAVPPARDFTYFYRPRDPGTYMYHCHFEDVEHVQMGMTGIVYVHPSQNYGDSLMGVPPARLGGNPDPSAPRGYAYNDLEAPGDPFTTGSTAYQREFGLLLNEFDTRPHDNLEAVQEFVWTDYRANYWLINGRSYPHTLLGMNDPTLPGQPNSSLIQVNEGEPVLLRLANLGYEQHAIEVLGVRLKVVGHDATLLRGPTGADTSYEANVIYIGPGEARDVMFVAPPHRGGAGPDVYVLRNRVLLRLHNDGQPGLGGMATEVRVYPAGTLPPQSSPNETYPE